MAELIAIFLILAVFAVYGVWKYSNAETNSYNSFVQRAHDLEKKVSWLEDDSGTVVKLVERLEISCREAADEVDKMQDHFAKLRTNQIQLMEKLSRKRPVLSTQGPIQVEILAGKPAPLKPSPNMMKKVKKQIEGLSK